MQRDASPHDRESGSGSGRVLNRQAKGRIHTMDSLRGMRVIEVSDGWTATTLAARLLAELGAEVVKLEPPDGDPLRRRGPWAAEGVSYAFELACALKRSVVITLEQRRAAVETLATRSDVLLIDAEAWDGLAGQGITPEDLQRHFPHLIICVISPFGMAAAAHTWSEMSLQAGTGLMATTGFPDDPPVRSGVPVVTHGTAIFAAIAVLAAVYERQRSGLGQVIDLAGYDVGVSFLGTFLPQCFRYASSPQRIGNRHPLAVPWNAYPTYDGWVIICTMGTSAWLRLLDVLDRRDLAAEEQYKTHESRIQHVAELDAIIEAWTRQRSVVEVVKAMHAADVAASPVVPVRQFLQEGYFQERHLLVEVPHPLAGKIATLGPVLKMSASPGVVERSAPGLGQDTRALVESDWHGVWPLNQDDQTRIHSDSRPLAGVRVVEMGAYTAVPYGTRLLALLGAEVIKVEPRQGDPTRRLAIALDETHPDSYVFHLYNTDKKSLTLETDSPRGKDILLQLLKTAHVFTHNLSQDYIERIGLDDASVRAVNPTLIYCAVSGFGQHGSWSKQRAFDTILQALGGIMAVTGSSHGPPVKVGVSIVDLFGPLLAVVGILAALYHRHRTAEGQMIDVALCDAAAWLTLEAWPLVLAGGDVPRLGNRHWCCAPHNLYRTRDRGVVIAVEHDRQWQALLRVIGRPDLLTESRYATAEARLVAVDEVDHLVATWAAGQTGAAVVSQCEAAGIPASLVRDVGEVVEHPLSSARAVILSHGKYKLLGSPLKFSRTPVTVETLAPAIGQHNHEVFEDLLALDPAELERLRGEGVF